MNIPESDNPTYDDLAALGQYVLNICGTMAALGHVSPAQSLVYLEDDGADWRRTFVLDAFALCLTCDTTKERARLDAALDRLRILDKIAAAVVR